MTRHQKRGKGDTREENEAEHQPPSFDMRFHGADGIERDPTESVNTTFDAELHDFFALRHMRAIFQRLFSSVTGILGSRSRGSTSKLICCS